MTPGPHGKWFATRFAPGLLLLGIAGGLFLANELSGTAVSADFWKQLLTITGVSALPLVVLAMRAPGFATNNWRGWSAALLVVSFVIVLLMIGTCLYEIAQVVPKDKAPKAPDGTRLRFACGATGAILAGIASGVVMEFFKEPKTMEPQQPKRSRQ